MRDRMDPMAGRAIVKRGGTEDGLQPFAWNVADLFMIDKTQAQLFQSLGRTRGLFRGVAEWPSLDEAFARHSVSSLRREGEERWSAVGGVRGPDGPTCQPTSPLAAEVIRGLSVDPGGLIWTDNRGSTWAVRLVSVGHGDPSSFFGFALGWGRHAASPAGALAGRSARSTGGSGAKARTSIVRSARKELEQQGHGLRLGSRAEQILLAIHLAVVSQRRSVVLLPDILLGEIVWGGDRDGWPQDWRRDLIETLCSLTELHSEVLRLSSVGWRPQLGAHSVAIAHFEMLWVTRPDEDHCRPACPMWNSQCRHHHLLVQVGYGFLGVLDKFAVDELEPDCRTYDFGKHPCEESGQDLVQARKAGQLISLSAPTAIFSPSKWSAFTGHEDRIIQALVGEVTRARLRRKDQRADNGEVLVGNRVPGRGAKRTIVCPLLPPEGRWIAFGGNGHRRGRGYLIVGHVGRGWLSKCGYTVPTDILELGGVIRNFLADLGKVRQILGLVVAGFEPKTLAWLSLEDLVAEARGARGVSRLDSAHLRIYAPEDYHRRCRAYFAQKGRFATIPGGEGAPAMSPDSDVELDVARRIRRVGIRQVDLAERLGVSQPFVSQLLNNERPWPDWAREAAETFVAERTALDDAEKGFA